MNKRRLHHLWTKLRWIKPSYFLVVAFAMTLICIFALRANNEHMIKLRSAVYAADKSNGNVEPALEQLQAYVTTHMNTNLDSGNGTVYPPIQLKYTYQRLLQAQSQAAAAANTQLYTQAQTYCQQQDPVDFSGRNRVPCIEQYVQTHDTQLTAIPAALYEFSFISPSWSSDLAGWSLLAAILSGVLFIISILALWWFEHYVA
jgi:preprotein translocase subunit SecF